MLSSTSTWHFSCLSLRRAMLSYLLFLSRHLKSISLTRKSQLLFIMFQVLRLLQISSGWI